MLLLDDERWRYLTTFFGEPEDLPKVVGEWLASIGSDQEDTIYRDDLFDLFLHQVTITRSNLPEIFELRGLLQREWEDFPPEMYQSPTAVWDRCGEAAIRRSGYV